MFQLDRRTFDPTNDVRHYYLAFEGDAEKDYFHMLNNNKNKLKIGKNVECIRLYRYQHEKDETNPRWIAQRIKDYKDSLKGKFTPMLFISTIIDRFRDRVSIELSNDANTYKKKYDEFRNGLPNVAKDIINTIDLSEYLDETGHISDINDAHNDVLDVLKIKYPEYSKYTRGIRQVSKSGLDDKDFINDKFGIVIDRDKTSDKDRIRINEIKDQYYRNLINSPELKDVSVYLTNPCFEFWLILHLTDKIDDKQMLENPKVNDKRYSERILAQLLIGYNKTNLPRFEDDLFGKDCNNVFKAIKTIEDCYTNKLPELEDRLGSNIGELIKEMQKRTESGVRST